jgi:succinate dehydrogenase / fumarate reductase cytochrome b subunit
LNSLTSFFTSSIGRKWVVASTGLLLVGFVVGHLVGNLQIFLGPESINRYGAFLQGLGELLWAVRLVLLLMFVAHIVATVQLRIENRKARPVRYAVTKHTRATFAARWMLLSGIMVLCFVIFHLLHFTVQSVDKSFLDLHDAQGRHDVFTMMVRGFSNKAASAFYIVGVGLLAMHLNHGFQSLFQTLGLSSAKLAACWTKTGQALSWLIFLGYASIPVAVLTGVVK